MQYKVPFIDFKQSYKKIKPEINKAISKVLNNGDYILRDEVVKFEKQLANYVGTRYAIGVNSGTDALFLSLKALGIGQGDEVITVSHTFVATIEAIVHCGAKPVLIDVDVDMLMNYKELNKHITKKTKAIIPVQWAGGVCKMDQIKRIARNIPIIEDAAQALGAEYKNKKAGSFGKTGCFSFYPAKLLGTYGDGGAITTNDKQLYDKLRLMRDHYQVRKGYTKTMSERAGFGFNSRLDNLHASILNTKFKYLDKWIKRRNEIAQIYTQGLQHLKSKLSTPYMTPGRTFQDYIIRVDNQNELAKFLLDNQIEVLVRDIVPNHKQKGLGFNLSLPITENLAETCLRLPCNPDVTNKQVKYVIEKINKFYDL